MERYYGSFSNPAVSVVILSPYWSTSIIGKMAVVTKRISVVGMRIVLMFDILHEVLPIPSHRDCPHKFFFNPPLRVAHLRVSEFLLAAQLFGSRMGGVGTFL